MWGYHEYRGGVQYHGGYHPLKCEYRGDIMMHVGDIMSIVGGVQYHGGYHPLKCEYRGDIMIHVGDIMSTVGGVQYRGVLR